MMVFEISSGLAWRAELAREIASSSSATRAWSSERCVTSSASFPRRCSISSCVNVSSATRAAIGDAGGGPPSRAAGRWGTSMPPSNDRSNVESAIWTSSRSSFLLSSSSSDSSGLFGMSSRGATWSPTRAWLTTNSARGVLTLTRTLASSSASGNPATSNSSGNEAASAAVISMTRSTRAPLWYTLTRSILDSTSTGFIPPSCVEWILRGAERARRARARRARSARRVIFSATCRLIISGGRRSFQSYPRRA